MVNHHGFGPPCWEFFFLHFSKQMKAKLIQRISVRQSSESGVFRSVLWSWCFLGAIRGFPFFFPKGWLLRCPPTGIPTPQILKHLRESEDEDMEQQTNKKLTFDLEIIMVWLPAFHHPSLVAD